MANILTYLSSKQKDSIPDIAAYEVWWESTGSWYVYYTIDKTDGRKPQLTTSEKTRIKEKLAARAKSTGLIKHVNNKPTNEPYDGTGNGHVGMQIR